MTKKAPNTATSCLVIVGVEGMLTGDDAAFHRACQSSHHVKPSLVGHCNR